jgi:hypothetical protein
VLAVSREASGHVDLWAHHESKSGNPPPPHTHTHTPLLCVEVLLLVDRGAGGVETFPRMVTHLASGDVLQKTSELSFGRCAHPS